MSAMSERFDDVAVLHLDTDGFLFLSNQQKELIRHLNEAGMWGHMIALHQNSQHNIPVLKALLTLHKSTYRDLNKIKHARAQVAQYLKHFFVNNGVYHRTSGKKLHVPFSKDSLSALRKLDTKNAVDVLVATLLTDGVLPEYRTVQAAGVDVVALSGVNFYQGLTTAEVKEYRKTAYPNHTIDPYAFTKQLVAASKDERQKLVKDYVKRAKKADRKPNYGFNERLTMSSDGRAIYRQVICEHGLYGNYVAKVIEHLSKAVEYAENKKQRKSILTLIDFYKNGTAESFEKHCIAWTKDVDSSIYFVNGLIESYADPLGVCCTYESIVAFKNPEKTKIAKRITRHIQWFEDNLPFDREFKKEKAVGLSASSVSVIGMAGAIGPVLPSGINLPNSEWIRRVHGSRSVNLMNAVSSRDQSEKELRTELYLPEFADAVQKYSSNAMSLHIDLHEIAGHGSGRLLPGISYGSLGEFYAVIEEGRADLVALYYMGHPKLQEIGVIEQDVNLHDYALAQYVKYLTNGAFGQLRQVELGTNLTQAHLRNRQLIANWVLEKAKDQGVVDLVVQDQKHYIRIHNVEGVRALFADLLIEVQRIKSTGDYEAAKFLVSTYGTAVDQNLHSEIISRVSALNIPSMIAFKTPMIMGEDDGYEIQYHDDFLSEQVAFAEKYMLD